MRITDACDKLRAELYNNGYECEPYALPKGRLAPRYHNGMIY